jgi:hypothetical protein
MQIEAHTRFYSPFHVVARLLRGRIGGFIVGVYASGLNRKWQREERGYLRLLQMLRPLRGHAAHVSATGVAAHGTA